MKEKIAFIDHNFHKKSRSADFLREIFGKKYHISNYWWSLKYQDKIFNSLKNYENFFFFQSLLPFNDMFKLKDKNIMWAPMYDNLNLNDNYWKLIKYLNIKVLCFSKKVLEVAKKNNCQYIYIKYFIKPKIFKKKNKFINIFFWYRGEIEIDNWVKYFDPKQIQIKLFNCPDPGKKLLLVNKELQKKHNIQIIKKSFLKKKEYIKLVKESDIFVSPRKQEGIGMSFLEAMSMGKYIIAVNDSTMNEYIINKKIGLIIPSKTNQISKKYLNENFKYRINYTKKLYLDWNKNKNKILLFFKKRIIQSDTNIYFDFSIKKKFIWDKIKSLIKKVLY